jgi:UDP-N-acetylmuramoylalanine--D-glutamate ligase
MLDGVSTGSTTCYTEVPEPVEGPTQIVKVPEPVEGPTLFYYASMEEAFSYIASHAQKGDICLLSPAASSYDQYKNFEERGVKFKRLAATFGK